MKTVRGMVSSEWRKENGKAQLRVVIPANSSCTVHVPAKDADCITEGGVVAADREGVTLLASKDSTSIFAIGSGEYVFEFPVS